MSRYTPCCRTCCQGIETHILFPSRYRQSVRPAQISSVNVLKAPGCTAQTCSASFWKPPHHQHRHALYLFCKTRNSVQDWYTLSHPQTVLIHTCWSPRVILRCIYPYWSQRHSGKYRARVCITSWLCTDNHFALLHSHHKLFLHTPYNGCQRVCNLLVAHS